MKRVVLNEGLERLVAEGGYLDENKVYAQYRGIFCGSGLEEIALPGTLREIRGPVFSGCDSLKVVWASDTYAANVRRNTGSSVQIRPLREAIIGGRFIWELRGLRELVIPDGFTRIWDFQFCDSGIESVTIPASVREISPRAFYNCKTLKSVIFKGAAVGNAGYENASGVVSSPVHPSECSYNTKSRAVGRKAFCGCDSLRIIYVEERCDIDFLYADLPD